MKFKKPSKKVVLITLLVLALGGFCWWYVTNFCGPYNKSMRYLEQMAEAYEKGDTAAVNEINKEYSEWLAGLSKEDSVKAFQAQTDFVREHAEYAPTANQEESEVAPVTEETYNDEEEDWSAAAAELGLSLEDETTEEGDSITLF